MIKGLVENFLFDARNAFVANRYVVKIRMEKSQKMDIKYRAHCVCQCILNPQIREQMSGPEIS